VLSVFIFLSSSLSPPLAFRDLKPANILLDGSNIVLSDLGSVAIARVEIKSRKDGIELADLCQSSVTAPYRAPELFDPPTNSFVTEASDIWALGCTLYAMAYREPPFDGTLTATIGAKITFPDVDDYGAHFRGLLKGILQTQPGARPTITQVQITLEKMQSSLNFEANNV
jgi:serine/threonine kinase 16